MGALDLGQVLMVVFSGVVAASTVIYAVLTWRLVSETRTMRKAQTEPRVSVHVDLNEHDGHGRMDLVIQNNGQGGAEDIRIEFEGDPTYFDDERPIDQLSAIKNGLRYLGPHGSFRIQLGWLFGEAFTRAIQEPWTFHLSYKNAIGDTIPETFLVDFSQFDGLTLTAGNPLRKIEKHLDSLRKDVHNMTTGFSKLHILTQTKEEYLEEYLKEREEARKQRTKLAKGSAAPSNKDHMARLGALGIATETVESTETRPEGST